MTCLALAGGADLSEERDIELVGIELTEVDFESAAVLDLLEEWNRELIAVGPELRLGGATITNGDFRASRGGAFFLARSAGRAIGCGGLRRLSADIGEIKRLFVSREARGQSAGRGLLEALEERARALGYDRLRLDTPGNDAAALALFRASGYQPIPDYNANTRARYWFEKALARD